MRHERGMTGGLLLLGLTAIVAAAGRGTSESEPPYTPAASIATIQLEPGYAIMPIASEPDVASPVAMDIDETGRLVVVKKPVYPLNTRPVVHIRMLEDTDGDGRFDRRRVFAEGLVLPTGVMRW